MADKTASVRLDLKSEGFQQGLKQAESKAGSSAKTMGQSFGSAMNAGAKAGLDAVKSMFSSIKQGAQMIGGLVGSIGIGALTKGAIESEQKFRALAFTMGAGSGEFAKYNDLQKKAQESALRWAVSSDDLAGAMDSVFNTVGDAAYTVDTMDAIAKAMRASGQSAQTLAPLVAEANRQFGITADQIDEVLPAMLSLGSRGGLSVQELGSQMGMLGSLASVAGEKGESGLRRMLAGANMISAASGRARTAVSDLNNVLGRMQDSATLDKIKKEFKLDLAKGDMSSLDRLEAVIKATKGSAGDLSKIFGPDLGATIAKAFGGFDNLNDALNKAAESSLDAAGLEDQANRNMESAQAGFDKALETLKQAFTKPEMMDAITELAQSLPKLAEGVASIVDMVVNNPVLAAGGVLGLKALGGGVEAAMSKGGTTAAAAMGTSITTAGSAAGAAMGGAIAALAIAAVAGAVDQGIKLYKDLKTAAQDEKDLARNMLDNAKRQGKEVAEITDNEGRTQYVTEDANGNIQVSDRPYEVVPDMAGARMGGMRGFAGKAAEAIDAVRPSAAQWQLPLREGGQFRMDRDAGSGATYAVPQEAAAQQKDRTQEIVAAVNRTNQAMTRTLSVKVTNEVRTVSSAPGGAPPAPGHTPRP